MAHDIPKLLVEQMKLSRVEYDTESQSKEQKDPQWMEALQMTMLQLLSEDEDGLGLDVLSSQTERLSGTGGIDRSGKSAKAGCMS